MKKTIDFLKTCLIYLLAVSMLTAAGLYINARQIAGQSEEIPREKMRIFKIGGMALAEIDENHIAPLQITVTVGGESFTAVYSHKSVLDVYERRIKDSVRDIFGKNSECRILGKAEGDALWGKCAGLDNSVYIKYAGNYIYPFIYTFLDREWDIRNSADDFSGELAMVRELFIVDDGDVGGVTKDMYGNVSRFVPPPEAKNRIRQRLGDSVLAGYKDIARLVPCAFLKTGELGLQAGNLKFSESFHLFWNYDKYSFVLEFSIPFLDAENKINTDHAYIKNLFSVLNFNIENSAAYSEGNGMTFRDSRNTVRFYDDGQIIYSHRPSDPDDPGGVHLAKFLGYGDDYYTYYEKIKAASAFVGNLEREPAESEYRIYLKNAAIDAEGRMRVVFAYCFEGIEIKINGSDEAIVLTINENSFTQIKINSLYLSPSRKELVKTRNPIFELGMIDREISGALQDPAQKKEDIGRKYNLAYDAPSGRFVVGEFGLVYKTDGKGVARATWELR